MGGNLPFVVYYTGVIALVKHLATAIHVLHYCTVQKLELANVGANYASSVMDAGHVIPGAW